MKISEKLNSHFEFEFLTSSSILEDLWAKTDAKLVMEAMNVDPNAETMTNLEPIEPETPKDKRDAAGKKVGVRPLDTQDMTKTQEMDPEDLRKTQVMDPVDTNSAMFKTKLNKLLVLAYKTSSDNFARAKYKTAKSGYKTIMHLASTIYKNIDQVKGPNQLAQVIKHVEQGKENYIEVARSYQQFCNSLKNLA